MSSITRICPSEAGEPPIPIVGTATRPRSRPKSVASASLLPHPAPTPDHSGDGEQGGGLSSILPPLKCAARYRLSSDFIRINCKLK